MELSSIISLCGFGVTAIALIKPIINLSNAIVELRYAIESLKTESNKNEVKFEKLNCELKNHDSRIVVLETKDRQ